MARESQQGDTLADARAPQQARSELNRRCGEACQFDDDLMCAVLSLGHPLKNMKRQGESYSYGAAGWLNDVDGVSYRLASSNQPISRGKEGRSWLYSVKDRYGDVERWGVNQDSKDMPWYFQGGF